MDGNTIQILVDTRERRPWLFEGYSVTVTRAGLRSGDYSLAGHEEEIALERKSLHDLVQSLSRGQDRFEREVERLSSMNFAAVLVEATMEDISSHNYMNKMDPFAVLQTIFSWTVKYRVPFMMCGSRDTAEYACYGLLQKYWTQARRRAKAAPVGQELTSAWLTKK